MLRGFVSLPLPPQGAGATKAHHLAMEHLDQQAWTVGVTLYGAVI